MIEGKLSDLVNQVHSLSREEQWQLVSELLRDLHQGDHPRRSATEFIGSIPWDGHDIDTRLKTLREEWD